MARSVGLARISAARGRRFRSTAESSTAGRTHVRGGGVTAGTATNPSELPWLNGIHCQRFFRSGLACGWFEVHGGAGRAGTPPQRGFMRAMGEAQPALFKETRRTQLEEADEAREPNLWMRRVDWIGHLRGLDRDGAGHCQHPSGGAHGAAAEAAGVRAGERAGGAGRAPERGVGGVQGAVSVAELGATGGYSKGRRHGRLSRGQGLPSSGGGPGDGWSCGPGGVRGG